MPRRLSPEAQKQAREIIAWLYVTQKGGGLPEAEAAAKVAKEFGYDSADRLYQQLADWGTPEHLYRELQPEPSDTGGAPVRRRGETPPQAARESIEFDGGKVGDGEEAAPAHEPALFGKEPGEELPDAAGAADLFRMIRSMLDHYVQRVARLKEFRDRGHFKTFGYYPEGRGAPFGDADGEDVAYPRGIMPHPAPELVNLIAMYLLCLDAGDDTHIDALLKKLHQRREDPEAVEAARKQVKRILAGTKDRPGLLDRARQAASAVRGIESAGAKAGSKGGAPIAWIGEEGRKRFGGVSGWWHDTLLDIEDMREELGEDKAPHPEITRMLRETRGLTKDGAEELQKMVRRWR